MCRFVEVFVENCPVLGSPTLRYAGLGDTPMPVHLRLPASVSRDGISTYCTAEDDQ
jgi:hypothetical protein